ncbi:MAG: glutamine synthetase type III [Lentisphaerae bacterium]|nr:glutamine synthetase type III [Lentisphaerota bacterium]
MSNLNRMRASQSIASGDELPIPAFSGPFSLDFYGEDVFHCQVIRQYLPHKVAENLLATINEGQPLDAAIADDVAHAMKEWALSRGATHFTHWFQPLTGGTAEKHDSFLEPTRPAQAIMAFSGKNLIVGEPDASSFPSGGLRCTFEARGYTAWDPTSPAFIKRHVNGATLCIPTAFCSFNGEALDKKTPLLRSLQTLDRACKRLMNHFGLPEQHTTVAVGLEQEYFLLDKKFYWQRPDLVQTGRTLFGAPPAKHQQLEDHYFGSIRPRILKFMTEVELDLWRLGIPAKTRHNEVAPAQFELAATYEEANLAVDHNMLVMEILRLVAERNGLICLMHEKPFAGVNGSGKHNNWSLNYGNQNLLDPGKDPMQNAIFLTVLSAVIRAVDLHSDLLRAETASSGNDHRLGANEAPPAIISMFLGEQLTEIISQREAGGNNSSKPSWKMQIGVDTLPPFPRDATDRNRTSPMAFTGNKFEFRAPGASRSCSGVNAILNTIVAESFDFISDRLDKLNAGNPRDFNQGLQVILRDILRKHQRIIFNGDNYSEAWRVEAGKRKLPNTRDTLEAIAAFKNEKNLQMFEKYRVFSAAELSSRYEISLEEYTRKINIEGTVALEIVRSMIIPAVAEEFKRLTEALLAAKQCDLRAGQSSLQALAEQLGEGLDTLRERCILLEEALRGTPQAVINCMAGLRRTVDNLEHVVADDFWPLPKYREMLFLY